MKKIITIFFVIVLSVSCSSKSNIEIDKKNEEIKKLNLENYELKTKINKLEKEVEELNTKLNKNKLGIFTVSTFEILNSENAHKKGWTEIPKKCSLKVDYTNNEYIFSLKGVLNEEYKVLKKSKTLPKKIDFGGERGFGAFNASLILDNSTYKIEIDFKEQLYNFDTETIEEEYKYNAILKLKKD